MAKERISESHRFLAHDPFGEHAAVCVETIDEAAAYLDQLAKQENQPSPSRYRLSITGFMEDNERDRFCALAWVLGKRAPLLVVLEEADQIAPNLREPRWLKRIIAQGRHLGISIIAISRRPAEVSRLLTSQADTIYCFRSHEPRDVVYLRQIMGADAERVPRLRGHQFIEWSPMRAGTVADDEEPEAPEETEEEISDDA